MSVGLIGRKCGMSRVYNEDGSSTPVTVIEIASNRITQLKTKENDGYQAIQVATGSKRASRVSQGLAGHYAKANVDLGDKIVEFRLADDADMASFELGAELQLDIFKDGQMVDVTGTSKGKGFAGVIKRYNFSMQDATHGNSLSHRAPGSIGQNQTPGRVFKGKKMAGQMGNVRKTIQNQPIVRVDAENKLLIVKGAVPGATGGYVLVKPAVKAKQEA